MAYCEYCQTEDNDGMIDDAINEKDLFQYDFNFMGEDISFACGVEMGELNFVNFDFNSFLKVRINYCPMCGRKLDHWTTFQLRK